MVGLLVAGLAVILFAFSSTDTTLSFVVVSDPCDGRRTPLTAGALTKK